MSATNFNNIKLLSTSGDSTIFVKKASGTGDDVWIDANGKKGIDSIGIIYDVSKDKLLKAGTKNVDSATQAQNSISALDEAIKSVSKMRADIGAYVNRLETTVNNLTVSAANQQAAESQIRDVDFAFQSSNFTKNQILTQSATAMLSQANGVSQNVLSLLR